MAASVSRVLSGLVAAPVAVKSVVAALAAAAAGAAATTSPCKFLKFSAKSSASFSGTSDNKVVLFLQSVMVGVTGRHLLLPPTPVPFMLQIIVTLVCRRKRIRGGVVILWCKHHVFYKLWVAGVIIVFWA